MNTSNNQKGYSHDKEYLDNFEIAPKFGFNTKEILNSKLVICNWADDYASKYQYISGRQG